MMHVGIVTDELSNLPPEIANENEIYMVSGSVYIDNKRYISRKEISTEEVLSVIGKKTLKTAAPAAGDYFRVYESILDKYDKILSIHCPTTQTGYLKSAIAGARRVKEPEKIKHFECGVAALGLGLVDLATAKMIKDNIDIDVLIEEKIPELIRRIDIVGALGSFDYLRKSGRVKLKFAGTVGAMLSIKPVLQMHGSQIKLLEKPRDRQKSLDLLFDHVCEKIDDTFEPKLIGISHLMVPEECEKLKKSISKKYPSHGLITTDVDPMIASNTGPGLILISYFGKDKL